MIYTLTKYTDHSNLSSGVGLVFITYKGIDPIKGITASFDLEVPSKNFLNKDGVIKFKGTYDDIVSFYYN
jgi:hypothetical protein